MTIPFLQYSIHGLFTLFRGLALDAAERFLSSVIISAHSFINPKASPYRFQKWKMK